MSELDDLLPKLTQDNLPDSIPQKLNYVKESIRHNTREAYLADINDFEKKKGFPLPATPQDIASYLELCALDYNPRTLQRRLTAIRLWHRLKQHPDPTDNELVQKTMKGIINVHGRPRNQAAAIRLNDLDRLIEYLVNQNSIYATRNQALLLVGFFGAFRCSELLSLQWKQVQFVDEGMIITLPRSKTDQAGEGAECTIPFGTANRCPVRHLLDWKKESRCHTGPVFRPISKTGKILERAMSQKYWMQLIRDIARGAGLPQADQISSHSLRRGFATEAARLGAPMAAIRKHGRWLCDKTVLEYIEAGRRFQDSAVNFLFDF